MSLLRDIQAAAIDSQVPLASLLRQCKVLAARLGNGEFKAWVDDELQGYDGKELLPTYRVLHVHSKGHFSGPLQSQIRNADIPLLTIPEKFRDGLDVSNVRAPVASLEALVANAEGGNVTEPWNPNLVAIVGQGIYQGHNCVQAWKVIPLNGLVGVLDAVRTRVLNFVLEIEAENPEAGEAEVNSNPLPQEKIQQIVHTHIYGNVQNVATGNTNVMQSGSSSGVDPVIFQEMLKLVNAAKADSALVKEMSESIIAMQKANQPAEFTLSYIRFSSTLADQITIWGPILAPFLPTLAGMLR